MQKLPPSRLLALLALALLLGSVPGQGGMAPVQVLRGQNVQVQGGVFAQPWEVRFSHIREAMQYRSYKLEQVRWTEEAQPRTSGQTKPTSVRVGVRESLLHRAAVSGPSGRASAFDLTCLGIEGKNLSKFELLARQKTFKGRAGFLHHYQSFRIADTGSATRNYSLHFLAHGKRVERPIYRFAVLPKNWDRSAWLLELDRETGYPLYRGEYSLGQNLSAQLVSEVVVTSYTPNVRIPHNYQTWWKPIQGIEEMATPLLALQKALPQSKAHVVPATESLPSGYKLHKSRVYTDPYSGAKKAVLIYSDGVDQIFVVQRGSTASAKVGHEILTYQDMGVAQCLFRFRGVEFLVLGRGTMKTVRSSTLSLYQHAIRVLN